MALTTAQLAALKAAILADNTLNTLPANSDGDFAIAAAFNLTATPTFTVWCNTVAADDIFNAVVWANLTPNDAPDTTQQWLNRAMACQAKQFNIQTMLAGRTTLFTGKSNIRAGLQDALTNVPSGTGGALVAAGWTAVRDGPLKRSARRIEALFADTSGGNGAFATPAALVFEGAISYQDVGSARSS
jgi:hypothetical protein